MAEITPSQFMAAFIIFVFIVLAGVSIYFEAASDNAAMLNDATEDNGSSIYAFNNTFGRYQDIQNAANSLQSNINETTTSDPGVFGFLNAIIGTSYNALKVLYNTVIFIPATILSLTSFFGIPGWMTGLAITFIIITFVFSLYSIIFQRRT